MRRCLFMIPLLRLCWCLFAVFLFWISPSSQINLSWYICSCKWDNELNMINPFPSFQQLSFHRLESLPAVGPEEAVIIYGFGNSLLLWSIFSYSSCSSKFLRLRYSFKSAFYGKMEQICYFFWGRFDSWLTSFNTAQIHIRWSFTVVNVSHIQINSKLFT